MGVFDAIRRRFRGKNATQPRAADSPATKYHPSAIRHLRGRLTEAQRAEQKIANHVRDLKKALHAGQRLGATGLENAIASANVNLGAAKQYTGRVERQLRNMMAGKTAGNNFLFEVTAADGKGSLVPRGNAKAMMDRLGARYTQRQRVLNAMKAVASSGLSRNAPNGNLSTYLPNSVRARLRSSDRKERGVWANVRSIAKQQAAAEMREQRKKEEEEYWAFVKQRRASARQLAKMTARQGIPQRGMRANISSKAKQQAAAAKREQRKKEEEEHWAFMKQYRAAVRQLAKIRQGAMVPYAPPAINSSRIPTEPSRIPADKKPRRRRRTEVEMLLMSAPSPSDRRAAISKSPPAAPAAAVQKTRRRRRTEVEMLQQNAAALALPARRTRRARS